MATLKDFYDVYGQLTDPFANNEITSKMIAFYDAVAIEQNFGPNDRLKFSALPYSTVLGEKAQAALEALKASVNSLSKS